MLIKTEELSTIFSILINKLYEGEITEIMIEGDNYWNISTSDWFEIPAKEPVLGSLMDDWENLQKVMKGEQIASFLDYDRFASIIRMISEIIIPTKHKTLDCGNSVLPDFPLGIGK